MSSDTNATRRQRIIQIRDHDLRNRFQNDQASLHFFYDETNNVGRAYLSAGKPDPLIDQTFVIAGLALQDGRQLSGWDALRTSLGVQSNAAEVKFRHIAHGDYLAVLSSRRLTTFLEWLLGNDVLVHYSALDLLYWSIIDIIESLQADDRFQVTPLHFQLKNEVFNAARENLPAFLHLLRGFDYPNVERRRVQSFLESLKDYVDQVDRAGSGYIRTMLLHLLKGASRLPDLELAFLHDNDPGKLIDNLGVQFLNCIYRFPRSVHVFDRERAIEKIVGGCEILDGDRPVEFRFADSEDEVGIQASDVLAGLIGKHFEYLRDGTLDQMLEEKANLSDVQKANLGLLRHLIESSNEFSEGLFHVVLPIDTVYRNRAFLFGEPPLSSM